MKEDITAMISLCLACFAFGFAVATLIFKLLT